ncbi:MAG: TonB-dependent receptor [Alphaproteobacteria bacterium]|nr:TonB-dependent receptor [Alphaproteobacteria bacterium]
MTFRSQRTGVEYQGIAKTGAFGTLIFGARSEREEAVNRERWLTPALPVFTNFSASQVTNSLYLLERINFGDLHFSIGGRIDAVDGSNRFATWRATAAYTIRTSDTVLRANAGTGARAPSLFQRFSRYGTPNLQAEQNFGVEAGIDQYFIDRRLKFSATLFDTRYKNLIDFDFTLNGGVGGYFNVGRARMSGIETAVEFEAVPQAWRLRAAYTHLRAMDSDSGLPLLRRPRDKGAFSVFYTGLPGFEMEARVTASGKRPDINNDFPYNRVQLKSYAKLDLRARYKVNDQLAIFARVENLTNRRYEEIRDYGTIGRAFFAGATVSW